MMAAKGLTRHTVYCEWGLQIKLSSSQNQPELIE